MSSGGTVFNTFSVYFSSLSEDSDYHHVQLSGGSRKFSDTEWMVIQNACKKDLLLDVSEVRNLFTKGFNTMKNPDKCPMLAGVDAVLSYVDLPATTAATDEPHKTLPRVNAKFYNYDPSKKYEIIDFEKFSVGIIRNNGYMDLTLLDTDFLTDREWGELSFYARNTSQDSNVTAIDSVSTLFTRGHIRLYEQNLAQNVLFQEVDCGWLWVETDA